MMHELKLVQPYFEAVSAGKKNFEVRRNDRDFQVGDTLILKEFRTISGTYTGKQLERTIVYLLDHPDYVKPGMVIMAIE